MGDNKELPFVSVIIPAYNEAKFVGQCLQSVLAQDWPEDRMEIILVDNGSTDDTPCIARNLFDNTGRGKVLRKEGGTIASVRNFGWRNSRGDVLAFLDGDSVVPENWLKKGLEFLGWNDVSCVGFAVSPPNKASSWIERTWYPISSSGKHCGTKYVRWLSSFNLILWRDYFEKVGGFDEKLETCEDSDLGSRLSNISKIVFSDSCNVGHLGTVNSIKQFFIKEVWRGKSNLKAFFSSKNKISEFPSIFVPAIYAFCFLIFIILSLSKILFFKEFYFLFFLLIFDLVFLIVLPIIMTLRQKVRGIFSIISVSIVYIIYFLARGFSIVPIKK